MAFNFGAFLGGAATQITKDIDEEEKRVKLRMDKILDRQQELTIQNQKEFKAKKEKVTNQMNALVPLFGGGPDAIAKARSIVAGGDNHYNFMFNKLSAAQERGDNINEIYSLIPNKDAVGFESVEDATSSLVKMAELPEITIGESSNMAKLFGIDQKAYFNRERQKLVEVGQIISGDKTPTETNFAQGKLNLDKMSKDFKSVSEMQEYKFASELKKLTPGSNEHKAKLAEYEKFKKGEAELTAGYLIAKYKEDNDKKTEGLSAASMQLGWQKEKTALEKKYERSIISSKTGKLIVKGDPDFETEVQKKIDAYNYEFVKGIVTDTTGLNVNGLAVITANPALKKLLPKVKKDLEDAMIAEEGKSKSEVKDIDPKITGSRSLGFKKIGKITDNMYGLKVTEEMKRKYPEVFKNKKVGSHFTVNEEEYKILTEQKNIQEKKSDVTKDKMSDDGILVSGARKIEGFFKKPPKLDGQAVQQDKDTGKYYLVIGTGRKQKRGRELTPDEIKRLK
jgi:hypothetical protein